MLSMLLYEALERVWDYEADRVQGDIRPFQDWRNTCELKPTTGIYLGLP